MCPESMGASRHGRWARRQRMSGFDPSTPTAPAPGGRICLSPQCAPRIIDRLSLSTPVTPAADERIRSVHYDHAGALWADLPIPSRRAGSL